MGAVRVREAAFLALKFVFLGGVFLSLSHVFARPKRFIVKIGEPQGAQGAASRALRQSRLTHLAQEVNSNIDGARTLVSADAFGMLVVESESPDGSDQLKAALDRHPLVEYYEPDIEYSIASSPSNLQVAPWLRDVMGLNVNNPAINITNPSLDIKTIVAVVDTGAMVNHPYLAPAIAINKLEYQGSANVDDDGNGIVDDIYGANFSSDSNGVLYRNGDPSDIGTDHGTHVAGLVKSIRDQAIAFTDGPDTPYAGFAREVQILPIRFINESQVGTTSGAIASLNYAVSRGAKVINCSWGARGEESYSKALYDAVAQAYSSNIVVVIAAGNAERSGPNNNDFIPYFPSSFNIPGVVSVASVTPSYRSNSNSVGGSLFDSNLSDFSNYGSNTVHIAAPGGYRDEFGSGAGVSSANAGKVMGGPDFVRKKGTSMATPVVAGVIGVMRAINSSLTAYEIKEILLNTAVKDARLASAVTSSGIVNARAAFLAAEIAVTQNNRPSIPEEPYLVFQQASSGGVQQKSGGCGAIDSLAGSSGEGPWGGNSILLFAGAYLAVFFVRSFRRKKLRSRV